MMYVFAHVSMHMQIYVFQIEPSIYLHCYYVLGVLINLCTI